MFNRLRSSRCARLSPLCLAGLLGALSGAAPAGAVLQDGGLDPGFAGTGKRVFSPTLAGSRTVAASGRTRDGVAYWWAGTLNDGATSKFSYAMVSASGPGQLDCAYTVPGATNVVLTRAAFDLLDRLVLSGYATIGGLQRFVLARIPLPEASCGALDTGFDETLGNADGWVIYNFTNHAQLLAMALDHLGGITLAGSFQGTPDKDILVVRLLSNGHLDNSFDADGVFRLDWVGGNDVGRAIALSENPAGTLHLWIGGYVTWNSPPTNVDEDFYVVKLATTGALETNHTITFDIGGFLHDEVYGMAFDASAHKLYAAGLANESGQTTLVAVARLDESGSPDNTFSGDGRTTFHFPGDAATAYDTATAIAVQTDGKAVIAGNHCDDQCQNMDVGVARLADDGTLDPTFDGDGLNLVAFDLGESNADLAANITLPDGRPLVGVTAKLDSTHYVPALFRLWNPLIFRDGFESGLFNPWVP